MPAGQNPIGFLHRFLSRRPISILRFADEQGPKKPEIKSEPGNPKARIEFQFSFGGGPKGSQAPNSWNVGPWIVAGIVGFGAVMGYNASRYQKISWKEFAENFLQTYDFIYHVYWCICLLLQF